jgi:flagellar hook-length control protein FliK
VIQTTTPQVQTVKEGVTARQALSKKGDKLGAFAKILDGLTAKANAAVKVGNGASVKNNAAKVIAASKVAPSDTAVTAAKKAPVKTKKVAADGNVDAKKKVSDTKSGSASKKALDLIEPETISGPDQVVISLAQFQQALSPEPDSAGNAASDTAPVDREAAFNDGAAAAPKIPAKSKIALSMKELAAQADTASQSDKAFSPESIPSEDAQLDRPAKSHKPAKSEKQAAVAADLVTGAKSAKETVATIGEASGLLIEEKRSEVKETKLDRVRLDIRDFRSRGAAQAAHREAAPVSAVDAVEPSAVELTVDLSMGAKSREAAFESNTPSEGASHFENLLSQELAEHLNSDLVQQAQVLLRDNNAGTIRLSLKPETLGNVKVHLEMVENKITGHIIVESNEALRAFEREIADLEQAFRDSGFDGVSFDTTLASNNGGSGAEEWRQAEARPFFSERFAVSRYEQEGPETFVGTSGLSLVDMLA